MLEGGTAPNAWIVLPPRIEGGFLEPWFSALSENGEHRKKMRKFDGYWEHEQAVADLRRNHSMFCQNDPMMPCRPHPHFQVLLWRELQVYGSHVNRVVAINRTLRHCSETLAAAHCHSERVAARARLKHDLGPIFEQLFDVRQHIDKFERDYWDKAFCVGSFRSKYADEDLDIHLGKMGMRGIPESLSLPALKQERNLDSTFQIRVGDLLRKYGTNPYGRLPLLTISRLVLLVYICAELATDINGHLTIWGSNPHRKLTVDRTYETLRHAGLR
jgi:hypothetical protein